MTYSSEITTDANSAIPATPTKRFGSALIDYIPMLMISLVISTIFSVIYFNSSLPVINEYASDEEIKLQLFTLLGSFRPLIIGQCVSMLVIYTYFLCKDLWGGRSWGKHLQKLQLVRQDGKGAVSNTRMIVRNMFIVIWPIELIMYFANSGQRLGDLLCKTTVVQATDENRQPIDKNKIIISVCIVFVCMAALSLLSYWVFNLIFDWYLNLMNNLIFNIAA